MKVVVIMSLLLVAACASPATSQTSIPAASGSPDAPGTPTAVASPTTVARPTTLATPAPSPATMTIGDGEPWIVYQYWDKRGDLRLIRPDGTGDHPVLATPPDEQYHPDWSPDGTRIAFEMGGEIWVVGVDGLGLRRVAACAAPCRDLSFPAWSPDGARIAFTRIDFVDGQNPGSAVQAVDVVGGDARDLFRTEGAEYAGYPRWSADGRHLVVQLDRLPDTGNETSRIVASAIAVVDLDAQKPKPRVLTAWTMFATYPDWDHVHDRIVFSTYDLGSRDGGGFEDVTPPSDLYSIKPDGSGLTQLTRNPTGKILIRNGTASGPLSTQPSWTPDGSSIIFVQVDGDGWPGWGMATIGADGTGLAPAAGSEFRRGTHPRLRPTP